jgi:hypothetical protein
VRYTVELGLKGPDGRFVVLARSNVVQTPKATPESVVDEHFMRVSGPAPRLEIVPPPAYHKPDPVKVPALPAAETRPAAAVPLESTEVLRKKLFAIYGVRQWSHELRKRERAQDLDLTGAVEQSLTTGFSSASRSRSER